MSGANDITAVFRGRRVPRAGPRVTISGASARGSSLSTMLKKAEGFHDSSIELLVACRSMSDTEAFVSALRNAGMPVHALRVDRESQLEEALDSRRFDLMILACDDCGIDLERAAAIRHERCPDLPLLVIAAEGGPDKRLAALRCGAAEFIEQGEIEHMKLAAAREYRVVQMRRELAAAHGQLKEAENRCTRLIESSRDAIAYIHEGMHIRANPSYLQMFGYVEMDDIEGLPIMDLIAPNNHSAFKELLRSLSHRESGDATTEIACLRNDGTAFDVAIELCPASIDGEPCVQIVIRDQSRKRELERKLHFLSTQDPHTGLANRQHFMQQLEEACGSLGSPEGGFGLFYILLDNFQALRATAGLVVADAVLKEVAEILRSLAQEHDMLARFGDHTFALISQLDDREAVAPLAARICSAVEEHIYRNSAPVVAPTCSIGVALPRPDISSAQDFVNLAYHACETARQAGGNQFAISDPFEITGRDAAGSESDLSELIDHALENGRFRLVFQPIVSLQGDTRENYAVLVRLLDKNDEEIQPDYFMRQAIAKGRMPAIDRWVIRNAIRALTEHRSRGRKVNFFISISGASLEDDDLLLWICDCLREFNAKGPWFTFQIAEEDALSRLDATKRLADGLGKIKCTIAISHYGLSADPELILRQLPINFVKFDPSFLPDLASAEEKQDTLNRINRLAQSYDIKTVATSVEDANSLAILWTIGVNYIRGYFLQEPSESIDYDFSHY